MSQKINLDELASGKLPEHINNAICKLKLTTLEMSEWFSSQPPFHFSANTTEITLDVHLHFSTRKFFALLGALVGVVWGITLFVVRYQSEISRLFTFIRGGP